MTVFKYFFKVLKKYQFMIILYTVLLIGFGAFSLQSNKEAGDFNATKPDVFIINHDEGNKFTQNLYDYIVKNANIVEIENKEQAIADALFYRDVNCIIEIPQNYAQDFKEQKNPELKIRQTGDSDGSYMEMLLTRYLKVANAYQAEIKEEEELIQKINTTIEKQVDVEIHSTIDTNALSQAAFYYNFANYSILAGCVFVIATVISSFKEKNIQKRTIISSMKYTNLNRQLFWGNFAFAFLLWLLYVIVSFVLIKGAMLSIQGLLYIFNSFLFMICSLSIALLIGNLTNNKNAINGIVNVLALGCSFLCGAFVPIELLPEGILKFARILPSYWYIQNNEWIKAAEKFDLESLIPFFEKCGIVILFIIAFVVISNFVTARKRKIA